ncbi:hypothetical protein FQA39_LY15316 [Lamprigera yunnana]|nr:hypothetical protein FQA39_LY15316 [Lamprigera yunnana]
MVNAEILINMNNAQSISVAENKSISPNTSPRSSPKPSPRPQTKHEHSTSESYLSVNYKEQVSGLFHKHDSSPNVTELIHRCQLIIDIAQYSYIYTYAFIIFIKQIKPNIGNPLFLEIPDSLLCLDATITLGFSNMCFILGTKTNANEVGVFCHIL